MPFNYVRFILQLSTILKGIYVMIQLLRFICINTVIETLNDENNQYIVLYFRYYENCSIFSLIVTKINGKLFIRIIMLCQISTKSLQHHETTKERQQNSVDLLTISMKKVFLLLPFVSSLL